MSRKREMDNLERDSAEAMRLGFGVHYGHYKAWQREQELKAKQEDQKRLDEAMKAAQERAAARAEAEKTAGGEKPARVCQICGGPLPKGRRKYCCAACADIGNDQASESWRKNRDAN